MNATNVVSLLLELNVIGTEDIDIKLRKIAARIANPDARGWFMRVPRFFLINLDKQASTPYTLPQTASKHLAFKEPGNMQSKPVTMLHRGSVEQEIDRTFQPYNPTKPPKKQLYKGPPAEVTDWMTAAKKRKDDLYFFDPYNRDQISFDRLTNIANWFNYIPQDSPVFQKLRTMRFDDIEGYREVSQQAQEWAEDAKDKPWKYRKLDGYEYGNMSVVTVNNVEQSVEFAKGTRMCIRIAGHAKGYLQDGLLYFVFIGNAVFACIHVESNQVRGVATHHWTTMKCGASLRSAKTSPLIRGPFFLPTGTQMTSPVSEGLSTTFRPKSIQPW
jgi:hypothetical protein